jgi:nitrogen fixation-related uncharacterized protein
MDTVTTLIILSVSIAAGLGALALAAARWGVDSRPTIGDDHAR